MGSIPPCNENLWHSLQIHICSNPNFIPNFTFWSLLVYPSHIPRFLVNIFPSSAGLWPFIFLQSWSIPNFQGLRVLRWNPEEVVTFRWSKSSLLLWWWTTAPVFGDAFWEVRLIIPFEELIAVNTLLRISTKMIVQVVNIQQVVCDTLPLLRGLRI